jgi:hypothetical protein
MYLIVVRVTGKWNHGWTRIHTDKEFAVDFGSADMPRVAGTGNGKMEPQMDTDKGFAVDHGSAGMATSGGSYLYASVSICGCF